MIERDERGRRENNKPLTDEKGEKYYERNSSIYMIRRAEGESKKGIKGKKDRSRENKETRGETGGEEPVDGKKGCAKRKKKETDEGEGQGGRKDVREGEPARRKGMQGRWLL